MTDKSQYDNARRELQKARNDIAARRLHDGFEHLRRSAGNFSPLLKTAEALEARYFYMLRFLAGGNDIGDAEATVDDITEQMQKLCVKIDYAIKAQADTTVLSGVLRYIAMRPEETLESIVSDYLAEHDRLITDTASLTNTACRSELERISNDIFNRLWTETDMSPEAESLVGDLICDSTLPSFDRQLWVHAIGLALLDNLSKPYISLLQRAHASAEDSLSTTAAVWLAFVLNTYPDIAPDTAALMEATHGGDLAAVSLEWCRSLATADLSKEMNLSLDPGLRRMSHEINEKLRNADPQKIDELLSNPDWLTENAGTGGFDSLKRFAEAQQNGDDIFMATLGQMRSFDFFRALPNWFLPFHTAHSRLAPVVDGEGAAIADTISMIPTLCDSDKYALLLSMASTPSQLRSAAFAGMSQQMHSMMQTEEAQEALKMASVQSRRGLINNRIKNIYRFFNLYPNRSEFRNPLASCPRLDFDVLTYEAAILEEIALTLFRLKRYSHACSVFAIIAAKNTLPASMAQKYAYALEQSGSAAEAAAVYSSILDTNRNDLWTAMRLASVEIICGNYVHAAEVLRPFEDSHRDDIDFLSLMAEAYTLAGEWEEAVAVYHNIDYLLPDDDLSMKPRLAWGLTVLGDYESADDYFSRAEQTAEVRRRHAVMLWLAGRRSQAIRLYLSTSDGTHAVPLTARSALGTGADSLSVSDNLSLFFEAVRYAASGSQFGNII